MKTAVCTLFEGNYGLGAGVLVNSLARHGFRGIIYAGYRGPLPEWVASLKKSPEVVAGVDALEVCSGVNLCLIPLDTESHLTNHKPAFLLSLWRGVARDTDALLYLDPDIVLNERWSYIEAWLQCGVALCEDVNSPLHKTHPRREGWRRYYGHRGVVLRAGESSYVNGGAVGTREEDRAFLETWSTMMDLMAEQIGGLAAAKVEGGQRFESTGFANCFDSSDQDSLNAAVEAYSGELSILGQEAMGLKPGHAVLPHALGSRKPWKCSYLAEAIRGRPPKLVDKVYWANALFPIPVASSAIVHRKQTAILLATAISRFYHRL
jgi:hypothetical protein